MRVYQYVRRLTEEGLKDFFPYTTMYSSGYSFYDETYEEISIVKELKKLAAESGCEFRLELYPHHKVLDIVIGNGDDFLQSNIAISYSLINEKIVGCDISDSMHDDYFTDVIKLLVAKYIEPIRGEIEKW